MNINYATQRLASKFSFIFPLPLHPEHTSPADKYYREKKKRKKELSSSIIAPKLF